jgi:anthranilate synthase/aminodeoxychorismate synthase-like glutamine amidotransferase
MALILIIDNYDSFTYNLVQRFGELDPQLRIEVVRNDEVGIPEIRAMAPSHLVISPGPCTPGEAGISVACARELADEMPILGVCLGHQAIGQAWGGTIVRAQRLMHGKTDQIFHDGLGLFAGLPNPMIATRYHSLVIEPATVPFEFEVAAYAASPSGGREVMGIRHKSLPIHGVQFHPESFLTELGPKLLANFLAI